MWIEGSFAVIWTYTPEVTLTQQFYIKRLLFIQAYPTSIRATGLGVANSVAKR